MLRLNSILPVLRIHQAEDVWGLSRYVTQLFGSTGRLQAYHVTVACRSSGRSGAPPGVHPPQVRVPSPSCLFERTFSGSADLSMMKRNFHATRTRVLSDESTVSRQLAKTPSLFLAGD